MAQNNNKNKLELTWIGKYDERKPLEPRILIENKEYSYGHPETGVLPNGKPWNGNMLIHGDNLLALKALEQDFAGQIKCIYIDPPYNTGNAFEHYDDCIEHSIWLSLMQSRLKLLRMLLADDGFIFVQIDNEEMAYLKVLLDEIFGRRNFINDIIWKRKGGSVNPKNKLNNNTDYILFYSKSDKAIIYPIYTLEDTETQEYIEKRFRYVDTNGRRFRLSPIISPTYSPSLVYEYKGYQPPKNGWSLSRQKMEEFEKEGRLYMPKDKTQRIQRKQYLDEYKGRPIGNLWTDINVINPMSVERLDFVGQKPETILERILNLSTKEGDLVLDSFLGTGTTAAVAQKMGRRYIGIELGNHAYTHCVPRLKMVTDGTDQGGISKAQNWEGGSGFKFYELAPSLLKEDKFGNLVINKEYNADMLAAAMAKQEGYTYQPSQEVYWKQGFGSETDYIYTTTQFMTVEALSAIHETMAEDETLLICCTSFQRECKQAFNNISIKKIPQMLLGRCEFGKDDYSLNIISAPEVESDEDAEEME